MSPDIDPTDDTAPTATTGDLRIREALERLSSFAGLARLEDRHARRVLSEAVIEPLEEAGRATLSRLGASPGPSWGAGLRNRLDPLPATTTPAKDPEDRVQRHARSILPGQARGGLERVQRLFTLDDPFLSADPRLPNARMGLIEQLNQAGRDVLGASQLRYVPLSPGNALDPEAFVDAVLARQAWEQPGFVHYCPSFARLLGSAGKRRREVRALALAAVIASTGEPVGLIEVTTAHESPFGTDDLALIALLADYCATVLERASRIEKLVFIDPMTAAYNRSYFDLEVGNEMARARRESGSMALCIVDIDDFKAFNSTYGYEGGNQVLVHVAQTLKRAVRPFDTVARWGGEEFAVLLTAPVLEQDVRTVSERLRTMVERGEVKVKGLDGGERTVGVTVSIGVALFPDHETTAADLWRAANQALLEAKRPPKNRVVFFQPGQAG